MILPLAGLLVGALIGAAAAARRGGNRLDRLQWAAVLGIMGAVAGLVLLILWSRQLA